MSFISWFGDKFILARKLDLRQRIIVAVFVVFVSVSTWYIFQRDKQDIEIKPEIKIERKKDFKKSRATFFNATNARIGLEIPEYWEGKYRSVERGSEVNFLYINNVTEPEPLVSIRYYPKKSIPSDLDGHIKLLEKNEYVYYFKLSTGVSPKLSSDKEYLTMKADLDFVLKSIK